MRILNIVQGGNLGGMEKASLNLLKEFKRRGHYVKYLSLNKFGKLTSLLEDSEIDYCDLDYKRILDIKVFKSLIKELRLDYDLVIVTGHNLTTTIALLFSKIKYKVLSIHFHHFENNKPTKKWKIFYILSNFVYHHIAFCSNFIKQEAISLYNPLKKKSFVLNNIIEEPVILISKGLARKELMLDEKSFIVGNAGWFIERKRFDVFIEIAKLVILKERNIKFVLAGGGPLKKELINLVKKFNLEKNIIFFDWVKDMNLFYSSIDLVLFNSDFDALGRIPLESAVHNTPVVASVINGGLKEVFNTPENIIVHDSHDVEKMSKDILELYSNSNLYLSSSRYCKEKTISYGRPKKSVDYFFKQLKL